MRPFIISSRLIILSGHPSPNDGLFCRCLQVHRVTKTTMNITSYIHTYMHTYTRKFIYSGGASAVKEPGHFEVRKSSSQVRSPRVPDAASECQNRTNKTIRYLRYGNIFICSSHYYRSKAIGRAEPGRWIFQPGHLTWRALV